MNLKKHIRTEQLSLAELERKFNHSVFYSHYLLVIGKDFILKTLYFLIKNKN